MNLQCHDCGARVTKATAIVSRATGTVWCVDEVGCRRRVNANQAGLEAIAETARRLLEGTPGERPRGVKVRGAGDWRERARNDRWGGGAA